MKCCHGEGAGGGVFLATHLKLLLLPQPWAPHHHHRYQGTLTPGPPPHPQAHAGHMLCTQRGTPHPIKHCHFLCCCSPLIERLCSQDVYSSVSSACLLQAELLACCTALWWLLNKVSSSLCVFDKPPRLKLTSPVVYLRFFFLFAYPCQQLWPCVSLVLLMLDYIHIVLVVAGYQG